MILKKGLNSFIYACFLLFLLASLLPGSDDTVIKAKKIYTVSGGTIENGMILIKNGKISRVGKHFSVPAGTKEIRAEVVIPGLIDIHSHLGVYSIPNIEENADGNEMTNPVTPQVHALDSFNFEDPAIKAGLAGGVTTIISRPGSGNVIGGTSVAVKLKDAPPSQMILKEICDLKMAIEGNPVGTYGAKNQMPSTLMAVYHLARKAFLEAKDYMESWEAYEKDKKEGKNVSPPKRDLGKEVLVSALKREIPVHIHCATASEIMSSIRLADEFNLELSLGHCYWAHLIVDELASRKDIHFNIGPPMLFNYFEDPLTFQNNPAILSEAGLKVSLQTDAFGGSQQNLRHLATLCVRYGMKEEEALKAITINAAEAVKLDERIGSIEKGKDADIVLLDGEPFEMLTSVEMVLIDGKIEYRNNAVKKPKIRISTPAAEGKLAIPSGARKTDRFAIKAGTLLTMAGPPVKDGVLLVKDGKIAGVGSNISIPKDWPVFDAREFVVMPGLISPRSHVGITANWRMQSSIDEISKPVVPALEVKHAIEPQAPLFTFARELGITTVMVTPGNRNVIGGQGAVLKTAGSVVDKMILRNKSAMVLGFGASAKRKNQMPSTRMGIAALMRETLIKAREYMKKTEKGDMEKKGKEFQRDLDLEALIPVLKGAIPVVVYCERMDDILTAMRIADEFNLKLILDGATDAYKLVNEIRERNIPVILPNLFRGMGNIEDKDFNPRSPAILAEAGIRVAFRPTEGSWHTPGVGWAGGDLLEIAAFAFKNGMPEEAALKAITLDAASMIGLDGRIGSLEPGKDADILILRGHPFLTDSIPEAVFIDGKIIYERPGMRHIRKRHNL